MANLESSIEKCRKLQKPFFDLCVQRARAIKRTEKEFRSFLRDIFVWGGDENYWSKKIDSLPFHGGYHGSGS